MSMSELRKLHCGKENERDCTQCSFAHRGRKWDFGELGPWALGLNGWHTELCWRLELLRPPWEERYKRTVCTPLRKLLSEALRLQPHLAEAGEH